jgi:hypothetical protein
MSRAKKDYAIHPLIFGANSILLYFIGLDFRNFKWSLFFALIITTGISIGLWVLFHKYFRRFHKSAIMTSVVIFVLMYFDLLYELLIKPKFVQPNFRIFLTSNTGQYVLLFTLLILLGILFWSLKNTRKSLSLVSLFLDIFSIVLCLNSIFGILRVQNLPAAVSHDQTFRDDWNDYLDDFLSNQLGNGNAQDVYYLVFDGYGGSDTLKSIYDYSNTPLINYLEEEGFYVLPNGRTNYNQTRFSISSSLNMNYWQDILSKVSIQKNNQFAPLYITGHNAVFDFLKAKGYLTITFTTGLSVSDIQTSDIYLQPSIKINPLLSSIINNSALSLILWQDQYHRHGQKIQNTLNYLKTGIEEKHPFLVYAHIMIPHPPFIYNESGNVNIPKKKFDLVDNNAFLYRDNRQNYINGYRNQIAFADTQIMEIIKAIREHSPDAIIIIQGDHGPGAYFDQEDIKNANLNEKFHILNAYYFPDRDYRELTNAITPVNTFRVIFNHFWGTNYSILENRSYYSNYSDMYNFLDITSQIK